LSVIKSFPHSFPNFGNHFLTSEAFQKDSKYIIKPRVTA
jgi:hypothetical protein